MTEKTQIALVEEIYLAALGDAPWEPALEAIRQWTGARLVALGTRNANMESQVLGGASDDAGWAHDIVQNYNTEFFRHDTSLATMHDWPAGRWYDYRQWNPPSQCAKSVTYQEFFRPRGFSYWEGTFLDRTPELSHMITLVGGDIDAVDSTSYRDKVAEIHKHLARAVRMRSQFSALKAEATQGNALLETLNVPMFLLDEQRRLLRANAPAQSLMAQEPGLRFVQGRFAPENCPDQPSWSAALESGVVVVRSQTARDHKVVLTLTPVPSSARLAADRQCPATLMVAQGVSYMPATHRRLRALYKLTGAEADVCILLCVNGLSPQECAEKRQVAIGTLRTQIKLILSKTGLKRLPELVRLVVGL